MDRWNRRRVLPVLCDDTVKTYLLPPTLSMIEYVNYVAQDKQAAFRLAKTLTHLSDAAPLPDPLPVEPPIPMSYLGGLGTRIDAPSTLSREEQSIVLVDIKAALKDRETREDAVDLLSRLRRRKDLFAHIADEIDEVLTRPPRLPIQADVRPAAASPSASAPPVPQNRITPGRWLIEQRAYGVVAFQKYTLDLLPDGSIDGASTCWGFDYGARGSWTFNPQEDLLVLEIKAKTMKARLFDGNRTLKISITEQEGSCLKGRQFTALSSFTLTKIA